MTLLSIVASLVIALAGALPDVPSFPSSASRSGTGLRDGGIGAAAPQPSIRVVSASHEISFPNELKLRLEAEADSKITEVTLLYHLGRENVRTYGYPSFTSSTRVTASFTIKTSGASYIPSGVDMEYYYLIRDAAGNAFETQRFGLEYKDPAFDWQRHAHGDIIVLWHDRSKETVARAAADVDSHVQGIKRLMGLGDIAPMKAVILNDAREARLAFPVISDTATRGHVFGGFAFGEYDLFVLGGLDRNGMVHEMTHLLIDEALDSPLAAIPSWLNEGLAMYFEPSPHGRETVVSDAARSGGLLPIHSMSSVPGRPEDVRLFYAQSRSLVKHMLAAHGEERMAALLAALNEGDSVEEAVPRIYGLSLQGLYAEWRTALPDGPALSPPYDPGTVGTSALIAAAAGVTAVVVLIRWIRSLTAPPGQPEEEED